MIDMKITVYYTELKKKVIEVDEETAYRGSLIELEKRLGDNCEIQAIWDETDSECIFEVV